MSNPFDAIGEEMRATLPGSAPPPASAAAPPPFQQPPPANEPPKPVMNSPPAMQGYGAPQPGFGAAPAAYGAPPPAQQPPAYGAPPPPQAGFGAPPAQPTTNAMVPSANGGGGYGNYGVQAPAAPAADPNANPFGAPPAAAPPAAAAADPWGAAPTAAAPAPPAAADPWGAPQPPAGGAPPPPPPPPGQPAPPPAADAWGVPVPPSPGPPRSVPPSPGPPQPAAYGAAPQPPAGAADPWGAPQPPAAAAPPPPPGAGDPYGAPAPPAAGGADPFGAPAPPAAGGADPFGAPAPPAPAADPYGGALAQPAGSVDQFSQFSQPPAAPAPPPADPFAVFAGAPAPAADAMVPYDVGAAAAAPAPPPVDDNPLGDFLGAPTPGAVVATADATTNGGALVEAPPAAAAIEPHKTGELPPGGEWYDARIFTPTLGVMFFKPQELTDSLFLQTDKSIVDALDERPVVAFIVEGSSARSAGVELGHVLLKVNGVDVKTPKDASRLIKEGPRPLPLLFYVPDTTVVVAEGEHMVKYDSRETTAPNSAKDWKPKYVVIGGIIAQPWMMNMYRSKSEYDIAVIETQARRPVSVKVKQFSLQGARIQNDWQGPQMVKYKNKLHPWKYIVVLPVARNPIKISSPNLSQLKPVHEGIRRVLTAQKRDRGGYSHSAAPVRQGGDPYAGGGGGGDPYGGGASGRYGHGHSNGGGDPYARGPPPPPHHDPYGRQQNSHAAF